MFHQDHNTATYQIQTFEPGRIKVNQQWYDHSICIQADAIHPVSPKRLHQLTQADLSPLISWKKDIVLIGTGPSMIIPPQELLAMFYQHHMGVEFMDSFAACRTYAALTSEVRSISAIIFIE